MDPGFDPAYHPKPQAFLFLAGKLATIGVALTSHEKQDNPVALSMYSS